MGASRSGALIKSTMPLRAPCRSCPKVRVKPRGRRTFWKLIAALAVGALVAEMQQYKVGPFRDMSWKSRRYEVIAKPERRSAQNRSMSAETGPDILVASTPIAEAKEAPSGHVSPAPNRTSSLLMVVGHMRRYEYLKRQHSALVRHLADWLGEPPTVCVVTYSARNHDDGIESIGSKCASALISSRLSHLPICQRFHFPPTTVASSAPIDLCLAMALPQRKQSWLPSASR